MGAIGGLRFDRGIPPRIEMNHGIGRGKIEPDPTGLKTDKKDRMELVSWKRSTSS